MESRRMVVMNLSAEQQWGHKGTDLSTWAGGGRRAWSEWRE